MLDKIGFFSAIILKTLYHVVIKDTMNILLMLMRKFLFFKAIVNFMHLLLILLICIKEILLKLLAHQANSSELAFVISLALYNFQH